MKKQNNKNPFLIVSVNNEPHEDCWIIGNTEALKTLHRAVGNALRHNVGCADSMLDESGEGYDLYIKLKEIQNKGKSK